MKQRLGLAHLFVAAFLSLLLCTNATSQDQKVAQPASSKLRAIQPPEHPIIGEQLRTFFKVIHIPSFNRQLIHEKLELQRKQLPEWYPQSVWDEIADSIENIDMAEVALPVYQKYVSQDDANFLIRFMATQGQKLAQAVLTRDTQSQLAGTAPVQARDQTIAELARNEGAEVEHILSGMSPTELHSIESQSAHWQEMQPTLRQMRSETGQAILAKQAELSKGIVAKRQSELVDAKKHYEASHPSASNPKTPH